MSIMDRDRRAPLGAVAHAGSSTGPAPGKQTLVQCAVTGAPVTGAPKPASAPTATPGGGAPLPPAIRTRMEAAFGTSFADVRVHEGGEAGSVGARAFARGTELHFAPGQYRPGTPDGDRLIGHELTHVVQQRERRVAGRAAPIQRKPDPTGPQPVYQYADKTTHFNDCGPASLLGLLQMIVPDYQIALDRWILAHRPQDQALTSYLAAYKDSTASTVGLQERLDVARDAALGALPGVLSPVVYGADMKKPENAGKTMDKVLGISDVRAGLPRLLALVNAQVDPAQVASLLKLATDPGGMSNEAGGHMYSSDLVIDPKDKKQTGAKNVAHLIAYLQAHCTGDEAVVALGVPERTTLDKDKRTQYVATGWGWGGTADPDAGYTPTGRDVGHDTAGHFVVFTSYDKAASTFHVLDPSFDVAQTATADQVVGFLGAYIGLINLMPVPIGQLRTMAGTAQASGATADHAAIVHDPALEAEADEQGARAAAGESAHAAATAPAGAIQRQSGTTLQIPAGPIPASMLQDLVSQPTQAIAVAEWCKTNLLHQDEMRAFWAANPTTRGATLGQLAVVFGRIEFMLGWIQQGGLSTQTEHGWEDQGTSADNQSAVAGDPSSNHGAFPGRYQAIYNGGKGMAGYDWCGMFLGYIYNELLKLDHGGIGGGGLEGWRGADSILAQGNPKIYPTRITDQTSAQFGAFVSWSGGTPRAGDLAIISEATYAPGLGNATSDTRTASHVGMVEEVQPGTNGYVRTIDGNAALILSSNGGGSAGSHAANAVSGRAYNMGLADKPDGSATYYNNQSRLIAIVRITDRPDAFDAPAAGAATSAPTGPELLARLTQAAAQVQAVLDAQPGTTAPYNATGSVRAWIKGVSN